MFVTVNGVRLFFDVEGTKLTPAGAVMREKPTLLLLHGGPGFDHSMLKPHMEALTDIVQLVYLDQRGTGRSERGKPQTWRMDQWAEDVRAFCDALGIERPIVLGHSSGGMVAQAYAARYPDHPAGLILAFSAPRLDRELAIASFRRLGGDAAGEAGRRFLEAPSPETTGPFYANCLSLYSTRPLDFEWLGRMQSNDDVSFDFLSPKGESGRLDLRPRLAKIQCSSLVLSGARDPIFPPALQDEIMAGLPAGTAKLVRLADTAHLLTDEWPAVHAAIRQFIESLG